MRLIQERLRTLWVSVQDAHLLLTRSWGCHAWWHGAGTRVCCLSWCVRRAGRWNTPHTWAAQKGGVRMTMLQQVYLWETQSWPWPPGTTTKAFNLADMLMQSTLRSVHFIIVKSIALLAVRRFIDGTGVNCVLCTIWHRTVFLVTDGSGKHFICWCIQLPSILIYFWA